MTNIIQFSEYRSHRQDIDGHRHIITSAGRSSVTSISSHKVRDPTYTYEQFKVLELICLKNGHKISDNIGDMTVKEFMRRQMEIYSKHRGEK